MTNDEFSFQAKRLIETFGKNSFPDHRVLVLFDLVKDLDAVWLKKIADQMIATMNIRFDLFEAARSERIRLANIKFTNDIAAASEAFKENITNAGLSNALKNLGAKSLLDAIKKNK